METEIRTGLAREEILAGIMREYEHNLNAITSGIQGGESILLGTVASQLLASGSPRCFSDAFLDDALLYTLAAQVGNHCVGLRPCAGTGDSCPYSGFIKAMTDHGYDEKMIAEVAALMMKIGGLFRVAKVTTGCNMEGFGAGSVCIAAATVAMEGGTPEEMERAMVLALSPTIGVPCTPRVLVPGLCSTHIAGAVMMGMFSARMCMKSDIEVNVPFDVIFAMAADVHILSGKYLVPSVVEYMEPFFKRKAGVEELVDPGIRAEEARQMELTLHKAQEKSKEIAAKTEDILHTLGDAVVGGSSQAVGSPTNAARICHRIAEGKIRKIKIELYPELFARRSINVPGVLMGGVYGASTSDYKMYNESVERTKQDGIEVEVLETKEHGAQIITLYTEAGTFMVDTLNRGGGRVVLRNALPSLEAAREAAKELGIVLAE